MKDKSNPKAINANRIIEMLDLEEQIELAKELGITRPSNLKDRAFSTSLTNYSVTTLLSKIVTLRLSVIQMLDIIHQFLEKIDTQVRTTSRAIVLPEAETALKINFDPVMKKATAISLNEYQMNASKNIKILSYNLNKEIIENIYIILDGEIYHTEMIYLNKWSKIQD